MKYYKENQFRTLGFDIQHKQQLPKCWSASSRLMLCSLVWLESPRLHYEIVWQLLEMSVRNCFKFKGESLLNFGLYMTISRSYLYPKFDYFLLLRRIINIFHLLSYIVVPFVNYIDGLVIWRNRCDPVKLRVNLSKLAFLSLLAQQFWL